MTFEDYLQEQFILEEPSILDDDIPDAFSDWIGNADPNDLIELGQRFSDRSVRIALNGEEAEIKESFDKQMGNPMEKIDKLT